jgi:hypothetical protein
MEVSGQLHAPAALSAGTHWIGDWVGSITGPDAVVKTKKKYLSLHRNRTSVVQPAAVTILPELPRLKNDKHYITESTKSHNLYLV